jgi:YfiH family protein
MHLVSHNGVQFYQFAALKRLPGLVHAVGCRLGGQSHPPYDGLNVSQGVGDDPDTVRTNRRRWLQATGGVTHVYARQNHGTAIRVIRADRFDGQATVRTKASPADALITDVPGICLSIQTADCQAVMLFDPEKHVVANVHCGWRGSVADLIGIVIARMTLEFQCDPGQMVAAIAPSLGPCCAEFINYKNEIPRQLWSFRSGRNHFDFWGISRHQLTAAGLKDDRVHDARICTRCNTHLFFSYRAARQTGRFATLIGMKTQ